MADQDATAGWDRWFRRFVAIVALALLAWGAVTGTTDRPYLTGALVVLIAGAPFALLLDGWFNRRNGGPR